MKVDKLTNKEVDYLKSLVQADKESIKFLRGFRKPTREEMNESERYNKILIKLECYKILIKT